MDITLHYDYLKKIVDNSGFEGLVDEFEKTYNFDFYSVSTDWYDHKTKDFVCKLKGTKGDVVITLI